MDQLQVGKLQKWLFGGRDKFIFDTSLRQEWKFLIIYSRHISRLISTGRFTTASDVWAYGVTLWEILTLAKEYPYSELTDEEVIQNVQKMFHGQDKPFTILPQPETCPDDLYELMKQCWAKKLEERPSFMELHSNIAERVRLSEVTI